MKQLDVPNIVFSPPPVCRRMWLLRFVCLLKPLLQMWHLKGQLPLCMYMWDLRSPGVGNDLEHIVHL